MQRTLINQDPTFKSGLASILKMIRTLPPASELDDAGWIDLFNLSKLQNKPAEEVELQPHDPVNAVTYFLRQLQTILVEIEFSQDPKGGAEALAPLLIELLPNNQRELQEIKLILARLNDLIHQSRSKSLTEAAYLNMLYSVIGVKLQELSQAELKVQIAETKAEDKSENLNGETVLKLDKEEIEQVREDSEELTHAKDTVILKPYEVTNALEREDLFAAIRALIEFGNELGRKYGADTKDYAKEIGYDEILPPQFVSTQKSLKLFRAIWDALDNLKSGADKEKHAGLIRYLEIGMQTWNKLQTRRWTRKEQFPEADPEKTAQILLAVRTPKLRSEKIGKTVVTLGRECTKYKEYLAQEVEIKIQGVLASHRQMHDFSDFIGEVGHPADKKADAILKRWDHPIGHLRRMKEQDENFVLLIDKYKKISELESTLKDEKKSELRRSVEFTDKFLEYRPTFEKRRDEVWKTAAKVFTSAIVFLASIPFLGMPYYYLHQKFWRPQGLEYAEKTENMLKDRKEEGAHEFKSVLASRPRA